MGKSTHLWIRRVARTCGMTDIVTAIFGKYNLSRVVIKLSTNSLQTDKKIRFQFNTGFNSVYSKPYVGATD